MKDGDGAAVSERSDAERGYWRGPSDGSLVYQPQSISADPSPCPGVTQPWPFRSRLADVIGAVV